MRKVACLLRGVALLAGFVLAGAMGFGQNVAYIQVFTTPIIGGANGGLIQTAVKLSAPAPAGGLTLTIKSSNSSVIKPGSTFFPEGASGQSPSLVTEPVAVTTSVTLTASISSGSSATTTVQVLAATPIGVGGIPTSQEDNETVTLNLVLNGPAPSGGLTINPVSSSPLAVCGPCVIGALQTLGTFQVKLLDVKQSTPVTVSAGTGWFTFNILPNSISLALPTGPFVPGENTTGTATLAFPASGSTITASVTSSSSAVTVPVTISFPNYYYQETFPIAISKTAKPGSVTITVTGPDGTSEETLQIVPTMLKAISVSPTAIPSGGSATATITLTNSTSLPTVVNLSADQPFLSVPSTVTVPAGATTAAFPVRAEAISSEDSATITAAEPGSSVFAGVTAGFNGTATGFWSTYGGDAQNSGRSASSNQTGALGWSRYDIYGSLLYGPTGTLFVVTPPVTDGTTFTITAVNPATGGTIWSDQWSALNSRPQVVLDAGGSLMVPTPTGIAYVNPSTGATKYVLDPSDGTMTYLSVLPGPADRIYVVAQSWTGTYVGAINIANDTFTWIQSVGQGSYPTLGLASDYNDTIYAAAGKLYAFSGASGKTLWSASSPFPDGQFGGTPAVGHGGVVYAELVYPLFPPNYDPAYSLAAFSTATGALAWTTGELTPSKVVLGWQGQVLTRWHNFQGSPSNAFAPSEYFDEVSLVQGNGDWIGDASFIAGRYGPGAFNIGNYGFNGTGDANVFTILWQQSIEAQIPGLTTGAAMAPDGTIFMSTSGILVQLKP